MMNDEFIHQQSISFKLVLHKYVFRLCEETQCFPTSFSTNSRSFYTSKRCSQIANKPGVQPDDSSVNLISHSMRFLKIGCPNSSTQTIICTICHHQHFFLRFERSKRNNRSKDFFLICSAIVC